MSGADKRAKVISMARTKSTATNLSTLLRSKSGSLAAENAYFARLSESCCWLLLSVALADDSRDCSRSRFLQLSNPPIVCDLLSVHSLTAVCVLLVVLMVLMLVILIDEQFAQLEPVVSSRMTLHAVRQRIL